MTAKFEKFKALHALPVSTVILSAEGRIVGVNDAWKEFADENDMCLPNFGIGANYLDHCGSDTHASQGIALELKELLSGRRDLVTTIYPCHSPTQQRWFFLVGLPLAVEIRSGVAILHVDLTRLLPIPIGDQRAETPRGRQNPTSSILQAIAGTVESSVSDNIAAQLNAMLGGSAAGPRQDPGQAGDSSRISEARLSKRQLEVLKLLGEGKTNAEIAKTLFRSPNTIKLHVSAILRQLNLKSRTQAALLASKLPLTLKARDGR